MTHSTIPETTAGDAGRPAPRAMAAAALLAILAGGHASRAQSPPSDRDQVTSTALFKEARTLLGKGDYAAACPKLEASLKLFATASIRLNLAKCHEHDGKLAAAWLDYQSALVLNKETPGDMRREALEKIAKERLAALEPRLPKLRIVIAVPPAGLRVTRDGQELPVATLGDALPVNPGAHDVEATAPGFEGVKQTVSLIEGQTREVSLVLTPTPPAPKLEPPARIRVTPPPSPVANRSGSIARRVVGGVLVGIGGAGLVVGVATGAMAIAQHASLAPTCRQGWMCSTANRSQVDAYNTKATVATLSLVYGSAVAVSGTIVLWARPKQLAASVTTPTVSLGPGALVVKGRF